MTERARHQHGRQEVRPEGDRPDRGRAARARRGGCRSGSRSGGRRPGRAGPSASRPSRRTLRRAAACGCRPRARPARRRPEAARRCATRRRRATANPLLPARPRSPGRHRPRHAMLKRPVYACGETPLRPCCPCVPRTGATRRSRTMPRKITVIGVPSSAGAFANGQEDAPAALRAAGLIDRLRAAGADVEDTGDSPVWRWRPDRARPRAQNLEAVIDEVGATRPRVAAATKHGRIPVVLGGDCTVGIGTVAGVLDVHDSVGLIYFDLHADMNTPASVVDGALDWTGVAHMLALDGTEPELTEGRAPGPDAERPIRSCSSVMAWSRRRPGSANRSSGSAWRGSPSKRSARMPPPRLERAVALVRSAVRSLRRPPRRRRDRLHRCAALGEHGPQHRAVVRSRDGCAARPPVR